jgi:hypothetical protein
MTFGKIDVAPSKLHDTTAVVSQGESNIILVGLSEIDSVIAALRDARHKLYMKAYHTEVKEAA